MSEKLTDDPIESFLIHAGVKGMKWGVRRSESSGRVQLGAAPRRAHANRKAAVKKHSEGVDKRRQARADNLIKNAGGNKAKAHKANLGAGLAASLITGIVGRTAVAALGASNPNVAEGVKVATSVMQMGITATTAVNAIRIQKS